MAEPRTGVGHHYPSEDVARWVRQFLDPSGTIETMSLLRSITRAIKDAFVYTRRSEKGIQSPQETLQRRRGSCRDFACTDDGSDACAWSGGSFRQWVYLCAQCGL